VIPELHAQSEIDHVHVAVELPCQPLTHERFIISVAQKSLDRRDILVSMPAIEPLRRDIKGAYAQLEIPKMITRLRFKPNHDRAADTLVLIGRHDGKHLKVGT